MINNPDKSSDDTLERLELPDLPKTEPTIKSEEGKKLWAETEAELMREAEEEATEDALEEDLGEDGEEPDKE